jgi:hypothetical protein
LELFVWFKSKISDSALEMDLRLNFALVSLPLFSSFIAIVVEQRRKIKKAAPPIGTAILIAIILIILHSFY